jgi:hypothetical protein
MIRGFVLFQTSNRYPYVYLPPFYLEHLGFALPSVNKIHLSSPFLEAFKRGAVKRQKLFPQEQTRNDAQARRLWSRRGFRSQTPIPNLYTLATDFVFKQIRARVCEVITFGN